ncbi:helix-turn-helix transcriptional regulator [Gordonia sp. HY002]|uniref:helix-turn-helix domain-containing protein n=1 Tax=Gordonia zhenghanii TaxID=2911516 RepID=UPI001EF109C1|nr:helix-turn-helix transcriptional regulator [Gordonia zhenghanii]MCF8572143.1 helix-turn-helix transcriptional regulator [Gordonia zhenghanii]MCF8604273.1 helix-turn-helix transcriptional regulator [Gordonia zhenghanii]
MNLNELRASRPHNRERVERIKAEMAATERNYRLREIRESLGETQTDLADRIGVKQARISNLERGRLSAAKVETVQRYVEALGLDLVIAARLPDGTSFPIGAYEVESDRPIGAEKHGSREQAGTEYSQPV